MSKKSNLEKFIQKENKKWRINLKRIVLDRFNEFYDRVENEIHIEENYRDHNLDVYYIITKHKKQNLAYKCHDCNKIIVNIPFLKPIIDTSPRLEKQETRLQWYCINCNTNLGQEYF